MAHSHNGYQFKKSDSGSQLLNSYARRIYSAAYRYNPRVQLVDVGYAIHELGGESVRAEPTVRVHLLDKPSGLELEAMVEVRPQLYIEKNLIPGVIADLIEADYHMQWFWPATGTLSPSAAMVRTPSSRFDPLEGGISISNEWSYGYGTLGTVVLDDRTGEALILSNWHVLAASAYARRGLKIFQPGAGDGGWYGHTISELERHVMLDGLDAAVGKLLDTRAWVNEQHRVGEIRGLTRPRLGMRVVKSGRGSHVTYGVVDGIAGDYPIRYAGVMRYIHHVISIIPQDGEMEVSRPGDSGSIWLDDDSRRAVALHFAGQNDPEIALAIELEPVLQALGVHLPATVWGGA